MQPAATPENEAERLASLQRLDLLDTPTEERFDRITRLARHCLNAPIALISLVDRDRQWFKSVNGLEERETGRDISFCGHAICEERTFEVEDARQDERFADNPLVTGEVQLRHYAGRPIHAPDGALIGTLCILGHEPRTLTAHEHELIDDLARLAEDELLLDRYNQTEMRMRAGMSEEDRRSQIDAETLLWNRPMIERILAGEFERSEHEDIPLAVMVIAVGREIREDRSLLAGVAEQVGRRLQQSDSVGRYDKDRFVIVLPNTLETRLENLHSKLKYALKPFYAPGPVTARIGWASNLGPAADAPSLLDSALRHAESGRAD